MLRVEDDNHKEDDLSLLAVTNYTSLSFPGQKRENTFDTSALQDTSPDASYLSEGATTSCLSAAQDDKDCKPSSLHSETELAGQSHSHGEGGFIGMETSQCMRHNIHNCPIYKSSMFCNRTLHTLSASTQHIPQQAKSSCMVTAFPWQPLFLTRMFPSNMQELVLKVRVQNPKENDFIEIELNRQELTYPDLLRVSCCELGVNPEQVHKIRKLPNTLVRKDKDVARLQDFQELEIVLGESINPPFRHVATTLTERPNLTY